MTRQNTILRIPEKYLTGALNEAYNKEDNALIDSLYVRDYCYLSGDGICDSPDHSVKYFTIVLMSVTQVTEAGKALVP